MPKTDAPFIVGVDIGGTSIKCSVIDPSEVVKKPKDGVLGRAKADTDADEGAEAVMARIDEVAHEACDDAEIDFESLGAVGIAAAGAVDHHEGVVLKAVNLKWDNLPLARLLKDVMGIPVGVENDVRAAVYGEQRAGAAKGCRDVFGVWVGTGIGGGLILNNELFFGHHGTAGEFGRGVSLPWSPPGEGSLEQVCSRTGISETIVRLLRSNRESIVEKPESGDPTAIRSKEIRKAFEKEDPLVVEVVEHAAQVLGVAIGGVVTLLALECVVLGGGFVDALGDPYLDMVAKGVCKSVFPDECRNVKVVRSVLGDDAGPVGAALLAGRRWGVAGS